MLVSHELKPRLPFEFVNLNTSELFIRTRKCKADQNANTFTWSPAILFHRQPNTQVTRVGATSLCDPWDALPPALEITGRGVDPMCFFWVRTHPIFRSWVRIGIGPIHFLWWIVYYCVCIQHDIDKSQISFIELRKTLRTNSGLRAVNSCLHLFWAQLCNRNVCAVSYVYACVWLELGPTHIFTQIYTPLNTGTECIWSPLSSATGCRF